MRKLTIFLLSIVLMAVLCTTAAAEAENTGKTVTYKGRNGTLTVSEDCEALDLGKVGFEDIDAFCRFLDQLPNLKKVDMYDVTMRKKNAVLLFERYPNVSFGMTLKIGDHTVRTDQTAFSTLHHTNSPEHSSSDFEVLKYCKNLQALDLGHNVIDDISWLAEMPQLKVLILADNRITDISPLANLKDLEYVELFHNNIKDLSPLAGCEKLQDLNICYNNFHDLTPLYGMKQLKRLWIYNYDWSRKVPSSEVTQPLQEALPDTLINFTDECTEGGWREHPHYDVLNSMFRHSVYMPFEDVNTAQ